MHRAENYRGVGTAGGRGAPLPVTTANAAGISKLPTGLRGAFCPEAHWRHIGTSRNSVWVVVYTTDVAIDVGGGAHSGQEQ